MALDIRELELDDANEAEAAAHGVTVVELLQLLDGHIRVFKNRKHRAGTHLLVGPTHGGRLITAPIAKTAIPGRWRPVTAWPSSSAEKARYNS
jgi:hypothetical protein